MLVPLAELVELIKAANFLDNGPLLSLALMTLAVVIGTRAVEQVKAVWERCSLVECGVALPLHFEPPPLTGGGGGGGGGGDGGGGGGGGGGGAASPGLSASAPLPKVSDASQRASAGSIACVTSDGHHIAIPLDMSLDMGVIQRMVSSPHVYNGDPVCPPPATLLQGVSVDELVAVVADLQAYEPNLVDEVVVLTVECVLRPAIKVGFPSDVMGRVLAYSKHHLDASLAQAAMPASQRQVDMNAQDRLVPLSEWNVAFFDQLDQSTHFQLLLAANELDHKPLLEDSCKFVAHVIKGKSPEEIRAHFNIANDFTAEEEEQIRRENEWCEERAP
jgi:S-phase kinase-associated protein 1